MQLVLNSSGQSHLEVLQRLTAGASGLVITSPFLSTDMTDLAAKMRFGQMEWVRIVTRLHDDPVSMRRTLNGLLSIIDFRESRAGPQELVLEACARLHGKAYILFQDDRPFAAIVTSANATTSGLQLNAEWGVAIRDEEGLAGLIDAIDNEPRVLLTETYIRSGLATLPALDTSSAEPHDAPSAVLPIPPDRPVWLKPWGVTENPVTEDDVFDQAEADLHFSDRPAGVNTGDLMLIYGVGAKRFIGVFRVVGAMAEATPDEKALNPWKDRWPWYVPGQNLTRALGRSWVSASLWATDLVEEFKTEHPDLPVTASGGDSLGSLQFGSDRFKLSPQFAQFVFERIHAWESRPGQNS